MGRRCRQQHFQQQPVIYYQPRRNNCQAAAQIIYQQAIQAPSCAAPKDTFSSSNTSAIAETEAKQADPVVLAEASLTDFGLDPKAKYTNMKFYEASFTVNGKSEPYLIVHDLREGVDAPIYMMPKAQAKEKISQKLSLWSEESGADSKHWQLANTSLQKLIIVRTNENKADADQPESKMLTLESLVVSGATSGIKMLPAGLKVLSDLNKGLGDQIKNELDETAKSMLLQGLDFATEAVEFGKAVKTNVREFMNGANKIAPPVVTALNLEGEVFKSNTLTERTPRMPLVMGPNDIRRTIDQTKTSISPRLETKNPKTNSYKDKATIAENPSGDIIANKSVAVTPESIVDSSPIRIPLKRDMDISGNTLDLIVIEPPKLPKAEIETIEPAKGGTSTPRRVKLGGRPDFEESGFRLEAVSPEMKKTAKPKVTNPAVKNTTTKSTAKPVAIGTFSKIADLTKEDDRKLLTKLGPETKEILFPKFSLTGSTVQKVNSNENTKLQLIYSKANQAVALQIYKDEKYVKIKTKSATTKEEALSGLADPAINGSIVYNPNSNKPTKKFLYLDYLVNQANENGSPYKEILEDMKKVFKEAKLSEELLRSN